jgi:OmpA-OmpF porin, OOP family
MTPLKKSFAQVAAASALSIAVLMVGYGAATAQQKAAALADHPLVGRLEGASLLHSSVANYDEVQLAAGQFPDGFSPLDGPNTVTAKGKSSLIFYKLPAGRSLVEVLRTYEQSLKSRNFDVGFTCSPHDGSCHIDGAKSPFGYSVSHTFGDSVSLPKLNGDLIRNQFEHQARYLYATLEQPTGVVHVAIALGSRHTNSYAIVRVIETKEFKPAKIEFIGVREIKETLGKTGSVDIYGILFDHDKDTLKPDSRRTLAEISKLLVQTPNLKLEIVGHTDNTGAADYNLDLSGRRAQRVVEALVREFSIAPDRLSARGAGLTQPVAGNESEQGRAKNRRVELVSK